jgi:hypothetical protein
VAIAHEHDDGSAEVAGCDRVGVGYRLCGVSRVLVRALVRIWVCVAVGRVRVHAPELVHRVREHVLVHASMRVCDRQATEWALPVRRKVGHREWPSPSPPA